MRSTVCSKPSTDSIAYGKARALQPDASKGLFEISVSSLPFTYLTLPQNFSAMEWHYLMLSKLSFTSGHSPSWGGSSGTPALVRVLLRAWAHPQKVASNMHYSASCLFHLRYPRDLSMLAYSPSYRCIVSYSTTSNPFYGH